MFILSVFIALLITLIVNRLWKDYWILRKLPPGFSYIPLVGSLPFVGLEIGCSSKILFHARKFIPKYGKLIRYHMGTKICVIVHDFKIAKEIAFNENFFGRFSSWYFRNVRGINGELNGVIFTSGHQWKNNRRFNLSSIKEFGFGKNVMDSLIVDETRNLLKEISSHKNLKEFKVDQLFHLTIFKIIWRLVAGSDRKLDDDKARYLSQSLAYAMDHVYEAVCYPALEPILPSTPEIKKYGNILKSACMEEIQKHREIMDESTPPKDFVDNYLRAIDKGDNPYLSITHLVGSMFDFFEAGADTVGSTMIWFVLFMSVHPQVQEKCWKEIRESHIGSDPCYDEDRNKLPYLEATIMEVQRISCVAPGGLEHIAMTDVKDFHGYDIPKGLVFIYNISHFMNDPDVWDKPEVFNPERFLLPNGELAPKKEQFVPFGLGKRICMGESLAKRELFIISYMLLQTFEISQCSTQPLPDPDPTKNRCGVVNSPYPFHVTIKPRIK